LVLARFKAANALSKQQTANAKCEMRSALPPATSNQQPAMPDASNQQ
jgi:hypothetical protein